MPRIKLKEMSVITVQVVSVTLPHILYIHTYAHTVMIRGVGRTAIDYNEM